MAVVHRGSCPECGRRRDRVRRTFACGHVDLREPETYRSYSCARCCVDLHVPRRLNRSAWLRWVAENASELTRAPLDFAACELGVAVDARALAVIARSQLLFQVCQRVAAILVEAVSRYESVPIDIGEMDCPECGDPLTIGDLDDNASVCVECRRLAAGWIGEIDVETVMVDYVPLDPDVVQGVILYLKQLAEPKREWRHETPLVFPAADGEGPLWDPELDGQLEAKECLR